MNPVCPACRTPTTLVRWKDIVGFECTACGGHCIRPDEVQAFFERHTSVRKFSQMMESARDGAMSPRPLECPDCRTKSYHVVVSGLVELDVCATCVGMYFDKHEATLYLSQTRATPTAIVDGTLTGVGYLDVMLSVIYDIWS